MESFVYSIAFAQLLLALLLLLTKQRSAVLTVFTLFVFLVLFRTGLELGIHSSTSGYKGLILGVLMASSLWLAPLLGLLTAFSLSSKFPQPKTAWVHHLILPILGALCVLPLILTSHSGADYQNALAPIAGEQWQVINGFQLVCAGLFAVQIPVYVYRCWQRLKSASGNEQPLFSRQLAGEFHLVRIALLLVTVTWFAGILRVLHCAVVGGPSSLSLAFSTIEVGLIMLGLVWLLTHAPDKQVHSKNNLRASDKYARSALNNAVFTRINAKLDDAITRSQWHLQPNTSLAGLSEYLNEKPHYVSQVINTEHPGGFFEWLNKARIQHACNLLNEQPHLTITDIVEKVGYASKSTFNTAFKQHMGHTPSQYKRTIRPARTS